MGRPVHYSAEVPARCQALIDMLIGHVEEDSDSQGRWGGPLKTTFLLAMATPMLVLPIERIFKPQDPNKPFAADDIELQPELGERVASIFGPRREFASTPFFEPGNWTYVASCDGFEVGRNWPPDLAAHDDVWSRRGLRGRTASRAAPASVAMTGVPAARVPAAGAASGTGSTASTGTSSTSSR